MKDENSFYFFCKRDIDEIYSIISPYMPKVDIKNLEQSIIYEENKKTICRRIKDENKNTIGNEVLIQLYSTEEIYKLRHLNNTIKLEKRDKKEVKKVMISFENCNIKRKFYYKDNERTYSKEEVYGVNLEKDFYDYMNSYSIETTMNKIKTKNKQKKRS